MSKADDKALKAARDALKERYSKTFQDLADSDAVPKWVEEAAGKFSEPRLDRYGHESQLAEEAFLAGARLIFDRLKATERGDLGDRKTADVWDTSTADYNSGRASVRREVLGDE